jgi:NhaP-type Na+/H+ or K+/H+ antiporter
MFSLVIKERLYLGEAPIATIFGIIIGPHVLNLFGPCMIYGWFISALLIWALIPGLNFLSTLVIAACVTPTDPILAQAVVGGKFADKHVPAHIRHLLSAESGSNDGAAFPFLYIALYLILDSSPGHAVGEWFYYTMYVDSVPPPLTPVPTR